MSNKFNLRSILSSITTDELKREVLVATRRYFRPLTWLLELIDLKRKS